MKTLIGSEVLSRVDLVTKAYLRSAGRVSLSVLQRVSFNSIVRERVNFAVNDKIKSKVISDLMEKTWKP